MVIEDKSLSRCKARMQLSLVPSLLSRQIVNAILGTWSPPGNDASWKHTLVASSTGEKSRVPFSLCFFSIGDHTARSRSSLAAISILISRHDLRFVRVRMICVRVHVCRMYVQYIYIYIYTLRETHLYSFLFPTCYFPQIVIPVYFHVILLRNYVELYIECLCNMYYLHTD